MPAAVAVAASGGRDSTALLHCTVRCAQTLGIEVHALHVHHGLVDGADAWLAQVRLQARRWGAQFHAARLRPEVARGESVEAWARRERYRALAALAHDAGCSIVLLAQHRRDQAETLLLQALRGGGPAGLAAMPRIARREGLTWARPWLDLPREAIEAYLQRHRLRWSDDSSNVDTRFARNRLRAAVWPALTRAFPEAEAHLHAAAARAAEATACLDELAAIDLAAGCDGAALVLEWWSALGAARRANLLRAWLRQVATAAPDSLVRRLVAELPGAHQGRWPAPEGELRLHDGRLAFVAARHAAEAGAGRCLSIDLTQPGRHGAAGWGGRFVVVAAASGGVAPERLGAALLRERSGGEQFQRAARSLPRSLKKQFQACRIPAWQREGPLVFDGDSLLYVPGLGIDARSLAAPGAPQLQLRWEPEAAG